ncbi:1-acyl-sn-glycerol-3-phosphate acyltransferase [Novosphingobium sp. 1949]|uniref:1-acyl-sn-glycerol-3-phosphate acyltransferase n=1 Tax=Novosphingobium organovorum TaxID=2930092 RepID=A0ABT0BEK1_9SPHN|nr:lysophospholipid acyltransferase family protein [Novosphingobium organovorum]MCJ2183501.1 1-acyl-sn-glycerol-3-phosphate acyltransferase [Novosphingobium organovorum]
MATRPVDVVRSLLFYAVFYPGSFVFVLLGLPVALIGGKALREMARTWSGFHRLCCRVLLGIKVRIEGEFPEDGVIVAMRHESFFEAIDMTMTMFWPVPFPKAELGRIPVWGWALQRYGAVMVERAGGAKTLRAMIANARGYAEQGRPLVIFPEGTRMKSGEQAELRSGFAGTYKMLQLPVVPVAVDSGRLYHRVWKKAGTLTYKVGARIPAGLPRAEIEARVTAAITVLG